MSDIADTYRTFSEHSDHRESEYISPMSSLFAKTVGQLPPELAQKITVFFWSIASNTPPLPYLQSNHSSLFFRKKNNDERLRVNVLGMSFPNPIGQAAGLDKGARIRDGILDFGFGFAECGTVTPRPQKGNDGTRLFRLREDRAVINRMGFNNPGIHKTADRLSHRRTDRGILGINIGANKDSADRIEDYVICFRELAKFVEYVTVNVSSPNTPGLRGLQNRGDLEKLLEELVAERSKQGARIPLLLKIAPDLDAAALDEIADVALSFKIEGLIVSNTTVSRQNLKSSKASEAGGLSGKPLFSLSTHILKEMRSRVGDEIVLIGVGGISSGDDAYAKIRAGASLVQLYTALAYEGPALIERIKAELLTLLTRDGFNSVTDAIGVDAR